MKHFNLLLLLLVFWAGSCTQTTKKRSPNQPKSNITVITSSDVAELAELLDFTTYKPQNVQFKFTEYDNSGDDNRTVPGPSDYSLEAVLYFDSLTFQNILELETKLKWKAPILTRNYFAFEWLPKDVQQELANGPFDHHARPDFFLGTSGNCWYLRNKILFKITTN